MIQNKEIEELIKKLLKDNNKKKFLENLKNSKENKNLFYYFEDLVKQVPLALGYFYEIGKGTEKDIQKAIYWYEKAVEFGNSNANEKLKELKMI